MGGGRVGSMGKSARWIGEVKGGVSIFVLILFLKPSMGFAQTDPTSRCDFSDSARGARINELSM